MNMRIRIAIALATTLLLTACQGDDGNSQSESVPAVPNRHVGKMLSESGTQRIVAERIVGAEIRGEIAPVYVDGVLLGEQALHAVEIAWPLSLEEGQYDALPDGLSVTYRHQGIPIRGRCVESVPNHEGDPICEHYATDVLEAGTVAGEMALTKLPDGTNSDLDVRLTITAFPQTIDLGVQRFCCGTLEIDLKASVEPDGTFEYQDTIVSTQDIVCEFDTIKEAQSSDRCGTF